MAWRIFSDNGRHGPAKDLTSDQKTQVFQALTDPNHPNREDYLDIARRSGMIDSNSIVADGDWLDSDNFATEGSSDFWLAYLSATE